VYQMLRSLVLVALLSLSVLATQIPSKPKTQQADLHPFVCPLCQGFVHQTELKYVDKIDDFQNNLDERCTNFFGPVFAQVCVNAFNNRIAEIKEDLEKKYSPLNVCQNLALCK
ncbi:hypothetical protein PMAYCL1PPCAC_05340, partial [Pristionchus mayeri]